MIEKKRKNGIKVAILAMSLVQMATNGMATILADIAKTFPQIKTETVQFLMTFPSLFVITFSLMAAGLSRYIPKKILAEIGLILVACSGILSFLFHGQFWILFVWAGFMGIGIGLVAPISFSLIADNFEGHEQTELVGYQTSASNIGSMMMTFAGGFLATISWHWDYLVYLLAIPGLFLTIRFIPNYLTGKKEKGQSITREKIMIPKIVWFYCLIATIFFMAFYMGPMNLALYVDEQKLGNASLTGIAATILLLGGTIMGILFGKITAKIGRYTIPMGFGLLAIGFVILSGTDSIVMLCVGSLFIGSSISLVMPQCTLLCMRKMVYSGSLAGVTMAMAFIMAFSNIGIFAAPIVTNIATTIMQSSLAKSRFFFTAVCCVLIAVVFYFVFRMLGKKEAR